MKIFPLKPNSKVPATPNGFKDAQPEAEWEGYGQGEDDHRPIDYNWGLPTGAANGITVLDWDDPAEADKYRHLMPAQRVKTPKGEHWYYNYTASLKTTVGLIPGLDIRNDGAYVVAAGSSVDQVEYKKFAEPLAEDLYEYHNYVPAEFIQLQARKSEAPKEPSEAADVMEGGRNHFLTSVAGAMRKQGVDEEALSEALTAINEAQCNPPLTHREVDRIANSVGRYLPDPDEAPDTGEGVKAADLVPSMYEYLSNPKRMEGESTGIEGMDKLLGGGYREGELIAIHAPGKTGKSTLLHKLIHGLVARNKPVAYASREMYPDTEVLPDILSIELQQSVYKSKLKEDDYSQLVAEWPLYFAKGYGHMPEQSLSNFVQMHKKEHGVEVFFVDHLQFLTKEEDYKEMASIIKALIRLAKEEQVCIVLVIQPKNVEFGQELGLNTLRGGAALGQGITALFTMKRSTEPGSENITKLALVAKRSKLAKEGHIHLQYDSTTQDLTEIEWERDEPEEESRPPFQRVMQNGQVLFNPRPNVG
jgi:KaiC/GvpD/RAD55 family RecA-like ATPase